MKRNVISGLIYINFLYAQVSCEKKMELLTSYTSSVMISPTFVDLDDLPCTMIFLR
jgi:hypothetical protein